MPECRVWLPHPTIQTLCPWFEPRQLLSTLFRRAPALPLTLNLWNELASAHSIANSYQSRTGLFHKRLALEWIGGSRRGASADRINWRTETLPTDDWNRATRVPLRAALLG